jgi:hypothetical protein
MHSAGFEPSITTSERSQTYVLERVATDIGLLHKLTVDIFKLCSEIGDTIFLRNVSVCEQHHYTSLIVSVEITRSLQEKCISNSASVEIDVLSVLGD